MIVDFHTHIYPSWFGNQRPTLLKQDITFRELLGNRESKMSTAEDLIASMDANSVNVSVSMGLGWDDHGLARESNDYIIESCRKYPDRLVGFASVNPKWGTIAAQEADRCARAGMLGMGEFHPDLQGFDLGDESTMGPIAEVAREHRLIVTTHSSEPIGHIYQGKGQTHPAVIWRFAQNFPDITLVCAHWGGGLPFYSLMPEVSEVLGNIYFDTAASPLLYKDRIFDIIPLLTGPDRILLGSDYPILATKRVLDELNNCSMSDLDKSLVMGGNAMKLLDLKIA